jgi:L-amino acid N-acyltransferase YncA
VLNELSLCAETDREQILEILNDAILNTTALYDYKTREIESMTAWFETKRKGNFPVVGIFGPGRKLLGFGTYGTFRNWPAYKYTVELSVYIRNGERGKGLGTLVLRDLCRLAEYQGHHNLIAGIDSENITSIKLHDKLGFTYAGRIHHAGYKFGKWLDLVFMQKLLPTPLRPEEG